MAEHPPVAIAILNWNGKQYLQALLPLLAHLTYPNYSVYIIDNNSSDDSVSFIQTHFPQVKTIVLDDNYGFATGYNKGLWGIKEEFYLMMNSDVEIEADFIEPLVAMMIEDKTVAVCQPTIRSLHDKNKFEHAGAAGGLIDVLGYPFCRGRIFDTVEEDHNQYHKPMQVFWATGTCCLIRRKAYWQIGGMYGYFFMHMEEIDMCWRFNSSGWKVMYCPNSGIYHLGGGTLAYLSPRKTYFNFRNNMVMCWRNSPWYINAWLLPLRMLMDGAAAFQYLIHKQSEHTVAIGKAYHDFFKWLFSFEKDSPHKKLSLFSAAGARHISIVWQYFISHKRKYSDIFR